MSSYLGSAITLLSVVFLIGLAATAIYAKFFRYQSRLKQRLEESQSKGDSTPVTALFKDLKRANEGQAGGSYGTIIREYFEQAHTGIEFETYCRWSLYLPIGVGLATGLLAQRWWISPVGGMIGGLAAVSHVVVKRRTRRRKLIAQLPKALEVISRAVRAGQTVPASFQIVADDFEAPIADEFRLCYEQQNLGIPYETALRQLARRSGIMELQILVVALLVQTRSGGNLVELLENLSGTIHKRLRLQDRVRALTGEGRMQAAVLIALPSVVFVGLFFIAHDYIAVLLVYPGLLATSVGAQLVGALWIRRCIHFEY